MNNKYKFLISSLSIILLTPNFSATAQLSEIVKGKYVYRILDAQRACVDLFAGTTLGANNITDAWHSPIAENHNRCKYKYVTTWKNQAGVTVGGKGSIGVGEINGSTNGSHDDNGNTKVQEDVIDIPRGRACSKQQGTQHSSLIEGYIYCRHNK